MTLSSIDQAARLIASAEGLLITAGAGMGVDSGLPDFRGREGWWNAYPALGSLGIVFAEIASPAAFIKTPRLAWGFYGHRLALYRRTIPHDGFFLLKRIADRMPSGAFVVTSNIDGHFQKSGFSEGQILEIHGAIHRLQCCEPCRDTLWSAQSIEPRVDDARCEWMGSPLPSCHACGDLARPNILMFNDDKWINAHTASQRAALNAWTASSKSLVVIEVGAGIEIPSIRNISQGLGNPVIRINTKHPQLPDGMGISLPMGGLAALMAIAAELKKLGWLNDGEGSAKPLMI